MHEGSPAMSRQQQPPPQQMPRNQYPAGRQIPIQREEGRSSPGLRNQSPAEGSWTWQQQQPSGPGNRASPKPQFQPTPQQPPQSHGMASSQSTRPVPVQKAKSGSDIAQAAAGRNSPVNHVQKPPPNHGNNKTEYVAPPQVNKPPEQSIKKPVGGATLAPQGGGNENKSQQRPVSPAPSNMSRLDYIQQICKEAEEIQQRLDTFTGQKSDKEYLFIEEMLTRMLIKLDNVNSEGSPEIRDARRQAVKQIQGQLDQLELKEFANSTNCIPPNENETAGCQEGGDIEPKEERMETDAADIKKGGASEESSYKNPAIVKDMVLDSEVSC